jgi:hypothetical protein
MPYLGNTPTTQNFTSGTDYFNGTGSQTAFTLSRSVVSVNDIQAVVNNVVQVPNDAYTLSGTTITFTSAPSAGTQNVYVRYLSTTTQVITPSQGAVSQSSLASNVAGNGPAFSAYSGANQTGLTSGVFVKVALNTETFDTNNNFDSTTNYRFTPTVAGYYQFNAIVNITGSLTNYQLSIYKNGAIALSPTFIAFATGQILLNGSGLLYCNGTTDYIELYVFASTSSGTWAINSGFAATLLSGSLVRAA